MKRVISNLKKTAAALVLLTCFSCMPIDYEGNLVNGYRMFKANNISIAIYDSRSDLAIPEENIVGMNVRGDFIFGKIDPLTPEEQRLREARNPGYFIVNTKNNSVRLGLGRQEWLAELKKIGIEQEPRLRQPSSFRNESALITALRAIIFGQR